MNLIVLIGIGTIILSEIRFVKKYFNELEKRIGESGNRKIGVNSPFLPFSVSFLLRFNIFFANSIRLSI